MVLTGAFSGGNSTAGFHGSPESSLRIGSGLISVRIHKKASENGRSMPYSATPKYGALLLSLFVIIYVKSLFGRVMSKILCLVPPT